MSFTSYVPHNYFIKICQLKKEKMKMATFVNWYLTEITSGKHSEYIWSICANNRCNLFIQLP